MTYPQAALVTLLLWSVPAVSAQYSIHAEEWARPRSGEAILELPAIRNLMIDFDRQPGSRIEIRYPGGEAGVLWAEELIDWLVALGVPSSSIDAAVGSGVEDSLRLLLVRKADSEGAGE